VDNVSEFGYSENDVPELGKEVVILSKLGIIDVSDPDFALTNKVTKGDFLEILIRMLGVTDINASSSEQLFFDVPVTNPYFGVVKYAFDLGLATGSGGGFFGVEDEVTLDQAIVMTVRALNYDMVARSMGGYPTGYYATAQKLGLMKGITLTNETYINMETALKVIYNAMRADLMMVTSTGSGIYNYNTQKDSNLLYTVFGVSAIKGIVEANQFVSLPAGDGTLKDSVMIDGMILEVGDTDAESYIGYNVEAFYREKDNVYTLLYVDISKNDVVCLKSTEIKAYEPGKISYIDKNGNPDYYDVSPTATTILNNAVYHMTSPMQIPDVAYFTLIDNNQDDVFDVVKIVSYETIVTGKIDFNQGIIYDKNDTTNTIDTKDYKIVRIQDANRTPLTMDQIPSNVVIQVARNSESYLEIVVMPEIRTVTIQEKADSSVLWRTMDVVISDSGEVSAITVAPSLFKIRKQPELEIGNTYTIGFNLFGEIAAVVSINNADMAYGYLVKAVLGKLNDYAEFQIFTVEGEFETLKSTRKIKTNKTHEAVEAEIFVNTYANNRGLIRYSVNSEGLLSRMDFPDEEAGLSGEGFRKIGTAGSSYNGRYKNTSKTIGGKILVDNNTVIFNIPEDPERYEDYFIGTSAMLVNDLYYEGAVGYTSRQDTWAAEVVVMNSASSITESSPIMVFSKKIYGYDADKNIDTVMLQGYVSGKLQKIILADNVTPTYVYSGVQYELQPGDVFKYVLNRQGMVSTIRVLYSKQLNRIISGNTNTSGFAINERSDIGLPAERMGNCFRIIHNGSTTISDDIYVFSDTNTFVYEYDSSTDKVKVITYNDIITLEDDPETAPRMYINLAYSQPRVVVVYK